jgi:dolichyl-phosphate beta-glucosyltransferase
MTDRRVMPPKDRAVAPDVPDPLCPTDHELTVVIPAYNEERRLPWTLTQLADYLGQWGVDHRVVVADDGSTDRTAGLVETHGPRFSVIRLPRQRGKGRAVRTAMLQATGRVVAFTDADLPYDLAALRRGHESICSGQCEIVFGARDMDGSRHVAPRRLSRRLATFAFRELVKLMISRLVTDTQCGLKLFSRRAAMEIFSRVTIDGFAFDAEVVLLAHRLSLPFCRVPVELINEYDSSLSLPRDAIPMFLEVMRLWCRTLRAPYHLPLSFEASLGQEPGKEGQRKLAA